MQHKRSEHAEIVQRCKNMNSCPDQNCWFRHEPYVSHKQIDGKQEVTEKMMEKFTLRLVKLENMINK